MKDPKVDEYDLSSVEFATCGAAPLKYETEEAFKEKFRLKYVQQAYGLTEGTLISTIKHPRNTKPATCGSAVPGVQIKVTTSNMYARNPKMHVHLLKLSLSP